MARLLLVDDHAPNLQTLEAVLSPLGHTMRHALGGHAALAAFDREGADIVLLDVRMPDLDGIEVLLRLRERAGNAYVPIILLTAASEREQRLRGLNAGADEFLEKPFDPAVLIARVQTLLGLKAARDDLALRNAELERLHREQRELSQLIVHDLKNPLGVVQFCVEAAARELPPSASRARERLEQAIAASARTQSLVHDLLLVARLERPDLPMRKERLSVADLFASVADAHGLRAAGEHIRVTVTTATELEVRGDPMLLRRMLENLVENAIRHTPRAGEIRLSAQRHDNVPDVEIAVSNSGAAIPVQTRERLFEKFWHGDAQESVGHAGLGLYFCKRAAEAHGGAIEVVETPEWPTSFVVHLPAA